MHLSTEDGTKKACGLYFTVPIVLRILFLSAFPAPRPDPPWPASPAADSVSQTSLLLISGIVA